MKLGIFTSYSCSDDKETYQKSWYTWTVVLFSKPIAFLDVLVTVAVVGMPRTQTSKVGGKEKTGKLSLPSHFSPSHDPYTLPRVTRETKRLRKRKGQSIWREWQPGSRASSAHTLIRHKIFVWTLSQNSSLEPSLTLKRKRIAATGNQIVTEYKKVG